MKKSEKELLLFFEEMNYQLCKPEPLSDREIKAIWNNALKFVAKIKEEQKNNSNNNSANGSNNGKNTNIPEEISVSEAIRRKKGYVKFKGQLMGYSSIYDMIVKVKLKCSNDCGFDKTIDYTEKPRFRSPVKELGKCPVKSCAEEGLTLKSECEYITTIDIELQDPDKFSEIE
jgi:hypothetical protein